MFALKQLLFYCRQIFLEIHQMDVETVFHNGEVLLEVYLDQQIGYENDTEKVFRLNTFLCGLKDINA